MLNVGKILGGAFILTLIFPHDVRAETIFLRCDFSMQVDDKAEGKKTSPGTYFFRISNDNNTMLIFDANRGDYFSPCESQKSGSITSCDERYSITDQNFSFEVMKNLNTKASYQYGNVAINRSSGEIRGTFELYYIAERVRAVTFGGTCVASADLVSHQRKF